MFNYVETDFFVVDRATSLCFYVFFLSPWSTKVNKFDCRCVVIKAVVVNSDWCVARVAGGSCVEVASDSVNESNLK